MGASAPCRGPLLLGCFLALLLPFSVLGKSCHKLKLSVPPVIYSGSMVGKVNLESCLHPNEVIGGTNTDDFIIANVESYYTIYSTKRITMPNHPLLIGIIVLDESSKKEKIIHVKLVTEGKVGKKRHVRELLKRVKRRWRPMPFSVHENYRGKFPAFVEQIQSDTQQEYDILYSISGQGVDQPPVGLFTINENTGDIYINGLVDREEYPFFQMMAFAKTSTGFAPEFPLDMTVIVEDDNDNAPVFTEQTFCAEVLEHSKQGTVVGRLNATDRDQPFTAHVLLRYYLIQQIPPAPPMFSIDSEYGIVTTTSNKLDRENQAQYTLIIEVRDMGGNIGYLSSTGTMSITVLDVNDFAPTFIKQSYQVEVNENESGMVILKIPVVDNDLAKTPNWRAVYSITRGNELGHFNITTDPNTNEGLLRVIKGLNYEETNQFLLQVAVANEVSLLTQSGTKSSGVSTVPVTVIVKDVDEGPECHPAIKEVKVNENQTAGALVETSPAIDPETKSSSGIRYQILSDPLSLFNIDANTGRLTTAKVLDYESPEIPSHRYNLTYLATDQGGKSGTCTLVIVVQDVSDIGGTVRREFSYCSSGNTVVTVRADADGSMPSTSFTFALDDNKDPRVTRMWRIVSQDGQSVQIAENGDQLQLGNYDVPLRVSSPGRTDLMTVTIRKCDCADGSSCGPAGRSNTNVYLGGLAILVMVLSALLFALLLFLLTACLCGSGASVSKAGFPDDGPQQTLLINNTEAPGADLPSGGNFQVPTILVRDGVGQGAPGSHESGQNYVDSHITQVTQKNVHKDSNIGRPPLQSQTIREGYHMMESGRHTYGEWHSFVNTHLGDKLYICGQNEENQYGEDYVVPYNYEGKGSVAGSVGCCSETRGEDDKLDFLNHLEPKFRTLAEVCAKK